MMASYRYSEIIWDVRYPPNWKELVKKTHQATNGVCCCCKKKPSNQIHHSRYLHKQDTPGVNIFPVCSNCHDRLCHSPKNWIKHKGNPLWKSCNTLQWETKLRQGFNELRGNQDNEWSWTTELGI